MPVWIIFIHWIARLILLSLIGLSIWSVSIMIERHRYFKNLRPSDDAKKWLAAGDWPQLERWSAQGGTPGALALAPLVRGGTPAGKLTAPDAIDRTFRANLPALRAPIEEGLTVLATLGSNAPFVGLFGTVLGIIEAFGQLSSNSVGSGGTQAVVGGISEALVATAIGLFVAIPAVVAYNYYTKQARQAVQELESLRDFYVAAVLSQSLNQ